MKAVAGMTTTGNQENLPVSFQGYTSAEPAGAAHDPELQTMLSQMRELEDAVAVRKRILAEQQGVEATMQALETRNSMLQGEVESLEANLNSVLHQSHILEQSVSEARAEATRAQSAAQTFSLEKQAMENAQQQLQQLVANLARESEQKVKEVEDQLHSAMESATMFEERTRIAEAQKAELEARLNEESSSKDLEHALVGARLLNDSTIRESLMFAARNGDVEVLKAIITPKEATEEELGRLNEVARGALTAACSSGNIASIEFLMQNFPTENMPYDALLNAAQQGHHSVVQTLLHLAHEKEESIVNEAQDTHGRTAMHLASMGGHHDTIKVLLHFGCDTDACDYQGKSVSDLAGVQSVDRVDTEARERALQALKDPEAMLYNAIHRANTYHDQAAFPKALVHLQKAAKLLEEQSQTDNNIAAGLTDQARYMLHRNRAHAARKIEPPQHNIIVDGATKALILAEARNQTNPELLELRALSTLELCNFTQAGTDYDTLAEVALDADSAEKWKQCAWEATQLDNANHYEVLCLGSEVRVEFSTIKKAFHKLSKRWHPDRHRGTEDASIRAKAIFQRMNEAYQTLSDESKRALYDEELRVLRRVSRNEWDRGVSDSGDSFTGAWFKINFDGPSTPMK